MARYPTHEALIEFAELWWSSIVCFDAETGAARPVLNEVHPAHFADFAADVLVEFDYKAPRDA